MDDQALDRTLARARDATRVDAESQVFLDELVIASRATAPSQQRSRRRSRVVWGIGGFVLAGTLVAGMSYQDYLLSIPPFAGLMDGEQRTRTGWAMTPEYGTDAGEQCVLYPEFRSLSTAQFAAVSDFVMAVEQWDALGAEAAQVSGVLPPTVEGEVAYSDALVGVVYERVQEVLPGIPFRARFTVEDGLATDPPSFEGFTMACSPRLAVEQ